jgi:hypothetical protein
MRHFAIYPDTFDGNTLGYWRFGERGGRLDSLVAGGPAFVNYGAEAVQDGYRFVKTDNDRMDAGFPGQPGRAALTLECWVRAFEATTNDIQTLAAWADATGYTHRLFVNARAYPSTPASSYILCGLRVGGVDLGEPLWSGMSAYAILAGTQPWHVAAVLDAPNSLRLFVNGVERAADTTGILAMPATNYLLRLGRWPYGTLYPLSAVLDEVRVSAAVRYAADFAVHRLGQSRRAVRGSWGEPLGLAAGLVT